MMTMTDAYTAIPVLFSPEDNEWLIDTTDQTGYYGLLPVRDYIRCDCHDAIWHYAELHVIHTEDDLYGPGELLVCDLPFNAWPDHTPTHNA